MATRGAAALFQVSTASAGTYTTIATMNNGSFAINGESVDVTAFAASYRDRIQTLKDITWDVSGFWTSTDTSGQTAVRTALANNSDLYIRCLVDGTTSNYVLQQVLVASYGVSATPDGAVELSLSFEGKGSATIV